MRGKILVVEAGSRSNDLTSLLREAGHAVTHVVDAVQALVQLQTESFDAVVCEQELPHLTGIELLERVCELAPDAQRFLVSEKPDHVVVLDAINRAHVHGLLRRSVDEEEVLLAVEVGCERAAQCRENRWLLAMARNRAPGARAA